MLILILQHLFTIGGYDKLKSKELEELKNNGFDTFILNDEFAILIDQQNIYWLILFNTNSVLAFNGLLKIKYNDFLFSISSIEKVTINSTVTILEGMHYFRDKYLLKEFNHSFIVRNLENGSLHYLAPFYNIFHCCYSYGCQHQKFYSEYDNICSICKVCVPLFYYKKCCSISEYCPNKITNNNINGLDFFLNYLKNKFYLPEEE